MAIMGAFAFGLGLTFTVVCLGLKKSFFLNGDSGFFRLGDFSGVDRNGLATGLGVFALGLGFLGGVMGCLAKLSSTP